MSIKSFNAVKATVKQGLATKKEASENQLLREQIKGLQELVEEKTETISMMSEGLRNLSGGADLRQSK